MKANSVLKRKDGILAADLNGETVMMDIDTGKYYNLGEVGGAIWNLLEKELTFAELVAALIKEYDVSEEQCQKDITPFLNTMIEKGMITVR